MPNDNLTFIKPVKSFKYSVNIKYDIGDFTKIDGFIPTSKNVKIFDELFQTFNRNAVTRAHLLIGAYGTGKSLFGTILATMLSQKELDKYEELIQKIGRISQILSDKMVKEIEEKDPYLIVLPTFENKDFKQTMLLGLRKALNDANLADIFPNTYFKTVLDKINQWKTNYSSTYQDFVQLLKKEKNEDIDGFINKLNNYDNESYNFFVEHYTDLSAGDKFNPFYGSDLNEIYTEVSKEIKKKGYQGIFIIFDEFNKLLEDNMDFFNGKELQDFAEMASRSDEDEVHLLLISHKSLVQYTNDLSKEQVNDWKKIEGRFKTLDASQYSSRVYELISNVIIKDESTWTKFKGDHEEEFNKYRDVIKSLNIFPEYNQDERDKHVLYGCYPLHPLSAVLLPNLSQKIAQNERTIFTFLSTEEEYTLGQFIRSDHSYEFPVMRPSRIYNYFQEIMHQELDYTQVHISWADSQRALQKIEKENNDKEEFIKTLGVISAVNNFSEIPPSKKVLRFALDYLDDKEYEDIVNDLIKDKVVIYRKSIDQFRFFEGSEIDFNRRIKEKVIESKHNFSGKYLLNDYFKPNLVFPKRYNDQFKIWRYFANQYLYLDELKNIKDWDDYLIKYNNKSYVDGMVIYLVLESRDEIKKAQAIVEKIDNERIIFVIPKQPLKIDELLRNLDAQRELLHDKELLSQDSLAEKELKLYIEETKNLLNNRLYKFTEPELNNTQFYHCGIKELDINSKRDLAEKVSEICFDVFNRTPVITNELVVKDIITPQQKTARKYVIRSLLFKELKERLGITGYGPDFLIYRTLLIKPNLLIENENDELSFNEEIMDLNNNEPDFPVNKNIGNIINLIIEEVYQCNSKTKLGTIYDKLRRPPYGIRLGVMPILLAIAGRINNNINNIIIRHNGEEMEIDAELFEAINVHPDAYTVEVNRLDTIKEKYIHFLENLFRDYLNENNYNEVNRLQLLYNGIKKWFQTLPKYARETESDNLSPETKLLRRILNSRTQEVKKVILEVIPTRLINDGLTEDNLSKVQNKISNFFIEENGVYNKLIGKLKNELSNIFSDEKRNYIDSLKKWYQIIGEKRDITYPSNRTNAFLQILRNLTLNNLNKEELLERLSLALTGFNTEDWNDNTVKMFITELHRIKSEVEGNSLNTMKNGNGTYKFVLHDKDGQEYKRIFEETELEGLSRILYNKIMSSFDDVGDSISIRTKQQILISALRDMFEKDLIT